MKKLFKLLTSLNWKYVLGEVILIFLGINLAIWFNNWNSNNKLNADKRMALTALKEEVGENRKELLDARATNARTLAALEELSEVYIDQARTLDRYPEEMAVLKQRFASYFAVQDSIALPDGRFAYQVEAGVNMELPELSDIAWRTAQSLNVAGKLDYQCLYELERIYKLQTQVTEGMDRALTALEVRNMEHLTNVLHFVVQVDTLLIVDYGELLLKLEECE